MYKESDNKYTEYNPNLQIKSMHRTVLSIAGSDPTGGAGIQADLKTMTTVGVYGAAAITCITVQNSEGVSRVEPLHHVLVKEQVEAVLSDHHVSHIKIGMVGSAAIARAISDVLRHFSGEVIYDPVLVATTGHNLTDPLAIDEVRTCLFRHTTFLTPNLPEIEELTGIKIQNEQDIRTASENLFRDYNCLKCILVTGGHAAEKSTLKDYLLFRSGEEIDMVTASHPYIRSQNTHGTGCTISTAFTSYLSLGDDETTAFRNSVSFLQKLLKESSDVELIYNTKGKGSLLHHRVCR